MEDGKFSNEWVTRASRVMVSPLTWTRHHGNGKTLLHGRTLLNPQGSGEQASYNCTAWKRYVNIMPTHTVAECAHKTQPSMPSSLCLSSEVPADLRVPHHQYHPCGESKCWVCLLPQDDLISARANILFFFFLLSAFRNCHFLFCLQGLIITLETTASFLYIHHTSCSYVWVWKLA